jgi:hypothetical protein
MDSFYAYGIKRVIILWDEASTTSLRFNFRILFEVLPVSKCRLLLCGRLNLPLAVRRNRFVMDLFVFIFGIGVSFFLLDAYLGATVM